MAKNEVRSKEHLKCEFTTEELRDFSNSLARGTQNLNEIQEEKTRVAADFKAKIEACTADTNMLARKINNGYEYRFVECAVKYHKPKSGQKQIVRLDTGEEVRVAEMTQEELQEDLDFAGVK